MIKNRQKKNKGQAMVEWALVSPLVIVIVFATCQWCMIEIAHNLTFDAAYKAARAQMVGEDAFDAAGITLLPVAGWSDDIEASYRNVGSNEEFTVRLPAPAYGTYPLDLPGWSSNLSPLSRSRFLYNRLKVTSEIDWDKSTAEVIFYHELLFPFVDVLFADIKTKQAQAAGQSVDETTPDGIGVFQTDISNNTSTITDMKAKNFVELRARATVPMIARPSTNLSTVQDYSTRPWDGIEENPGEQLIQRASTIVWSTN